MDRKRPAWLLWFVVGATGLAVGLLAMQPASSGERVTDAMIAAMFDKSHSIMKDQRERIHGIMDGFLVGDLEAIQRYVEGLREDMVSAGNQFPPEVGRETDQWQAMAAILQSADGMQREVLTGNYREVHRHFFNLTNQCIACHQIRREWGRFPEPQSMNEEAQDGPEAL